MTWSEGSIPHRGPTFDRSIGRVSVFVCTRAEEERAQVERALRGRAAVRFCDRATELALCAAAAPDAVMFVVRVYLAALPDLVMQLTKLRRRFPDFPVMLIADVGHSSGNAERILSAAATVQAEAVLFAGDDLSPVLNTLLAMTTARSSGRRILGALAPDLPAMDPTVREFVEVCIGATRDLRTVDAVCRTIGTSLRTLERRLSQSGLPSAHVWFWSIMVLRAMRLLRDPLCTIDRVVAQLPFPSRSAVTSRFRRYAGIRPREARQPGVSDAVFDRVARRFTSPGSQETRTHSQRKRGATASPSAVTRTVLEVTRMHSKTVPGTNMSLHNSSADVHREPSTRDADDSGLGRTAHRAHASHSRRQAGLLTALRGDIRYAFRSLWAPRSRIATTAAILALTLGIGATTAIFSVVEPVLLQSLPYRNADRLAVVRLAQPNERTSSGSVASMEALVAWRSRANAFEELAAYATGSTILTARGDALRVHTIAVTANTMSFLGASPIVGRAFVENDDRVGAAAVTILSDAFWTRHFGRDPLILGQTVTLDGRTFEIVGVMPAGFRVPNSVPEDSKFDAELWVPIGQYREWKSLPSGPSLPVEVLGRLRRDVGLPAAERQLSQIVAQVTSSLPNASAERSPGALIVPLSEVVAGQVRRPLLVLMSAAAFVLLTACANVATLQLARALSQRQELAVRSALGAKPIRLVRQLLTESATLAFVGGMFGVALAAWAVPFLVRMATTQLPDVGPIGLNGIVLSAAVIVSIGSGLVVGFAPAAQALRSRLVATLRDDTAGAGQSMRQKRTTSALVAGQVAFTMVLLATAGLLTRSFIQLVGGDRGFDGKRVAVATMFMPKEGYPTRVEQEAFAERVLEKVQAIPGVARAAVATGAPIVRGMTANVTPDDSPDREARRMATWAVSADYFALLGMSIRRGRLLEPNDITEVVLDEAGARELFADQDALGRHVQWAIGADTAIGTIVGIVGNVQEFSINTRDNSRLRTSAAHLFVPLASGIAPPLRVVAQARTDPVQLLPHLRRTIGEVDPNLPIDLLTSMEQLELRTLARERLLTVLTLLFAGVAFIIAAIGIYGVIAYSTARRTREFGLRIALGARRVDIIGLTLRHGAALAVIGIAFGLGGTFAVSRVLRSLLFEVSPTDPLVLFGVAAVLVLTALAASYIPARRATRANPATSLQPQ